MKPEDILTPTQLAERLQVKPSWVYEKCRRAQNTMANQCLACASAVFALLLAGHLRLDAQWEQQPPRRLTSPLVASPYFANQHRSFERFYARPSFVHLVDSSYIFGYAEGLSGAALRSRFLQSTSWAQRDMMGAEAV